jgi:hypothetical protein
MDKHTSLFCSTVASDKEEKFYDLDASEEGKNKS